MWFEGLRGKQHPTESLDQAEQKARSSAARRQLSTPTVTPNGEQQTQPVSSTQLDKRPLPTELMATTYQLPEAVQSRMAGDMSVETRDRIVADRETILSKAGTRIHRANQG